MADIQLWREAAAEMGLKGPEIIAFVREQHDIAREERRMQREDAQAQQKDAQAQAQQEEAQAARDVAPAQAQREHELEVLRLRRNRQQDQQNERSNTKTPKLPSFVEGKDEIDNFIRRFERYALANGCAEENWAISLGALLTGKALEAYTRLSEEDASNYVELKNALLKRYNLTAKGYHGKFRKGRPETEESIDQFIFCIKTYLEKWVELADVEATVEGVKNLMIKEQVIEACPRDLSIHLQERNPRTLAELSKIAEQYLKARGGQLHQGWRLENKGKYDPNNNRKPFQPTATESDPPKTGMNCYNCKQPGHIANNCKAPKKEFNPDIKCQGCGKKGHKLSNCYSRKINLTGAMMELEDPEEREDIVNNCGAGSFLIPEIEEDNKKDSLNDCIVNNKLMLINGRHLELVLNSQQQ